MKTQQKCDHFLEALYVVFLAFCLALLSSCSHDPKLERKIDAEAQAQPVQNIDARTAEADKQIDASPLSEKPKAKLEQLANPTSTEIKKLREEEARLRLLLVKNMLNPQVSDREIDAIKRKILVTNKDANSKWLKTIDETRRVIGRRSMQDMRY